MWCKRFRIAGGSTPGRLAGRGRFAPLEMQKLQASASSQHGSRQDGGATFKLGHYQLLHSLVIRQDLITRGTASHCGEEALKSL